MQGSKMLKVTSILMIVFGAIGLVLTLVSLSTLGALTTLAEAMGVDVPVGLLTFASILAVAGGAAQLVSGIIGVKNWNNPQKAGSCILWGIIVIALCLISNIFTLIGYAANFNILSLLIGLVIPVLYLIGAFQNKKA